VQGGVDNHALQALQANDLHVTCADFAGVFVDFAGLFQCFFIIIF